jgi:hypothetical protein
MFASLSMNPIDYQTPRKNDKVASKTLGRSPATALIVAAGLMFGVPLVSAATASFGYHWLVQNVPQDALLMGAVTLAGLWIATLLMALTCGIIWIGTVVDVRLGNVQLSSRDKIGVTLYGSAVVTWIVFFVFTWLSR